MGFIPRRSIPRPPRLSFIVPIGHHVFVNCRAGTSRSVLLGDESGSEMLGTSLADGVEVEVMAWRPRGPTDTRYRVRTTVGERFDGWVFAQELRRSLLPTAETAASVPAAAARAPADKTLDTSAAVAIPPAATSGRSVV